MDNKFLSVLIITLAIIFAACKTVPADNSDFLGDYPAQELTTIMLNTIAQGENELIPREVRFTFHPRVNMVEVNLKYGVNNVTMALTEENRTALRQAMQRYLADYKAGKLGVESNLRQALFGDTSVLIMWGVLAPTYYAKPRMRFEYQLITLERPYFVMGNRSAPQTSSTGKVLSDGTNSPALRIAFSPIHCNTLLELLDQQYLLGIVQKMTEEASQFDIVEDEAAADEPIEEKPLF